MKINAQRSNWGVTGFLAQRISSVVLAGYVLLLSGCFLLNPDIDGQQLRGLFAHPLMMAFAVVALLAYLAHAWVGLWTIGTDYVRPHYFGRFAALARLLYHAVVIAMLALQALWWLFITFSL